MIIFILFIIAVVIDLLTNKKKTMLKPEELIKDKWYVFTAYNNDILAKFDDYRNNAIFSSKWALNGVIFTRGAWNYSELKGLREATKKEVIMYFPDEKFDDKIELIEGDIYTCKFDNSDYIFKHENNNTNIKHIAILHCTYSGNGWQFYLDKRQSKDLKKALFSDRQWLEACIKANKHMTKEEALRGYDIYGKSLNNITEYYEYIDKFETSFTKGKIYKLNKGKTINDSEAFTDDSGYANGYYPNNHKYFKLSTKEAFEAQNKPKSLVGRYVEALKDQAQCIANTKKGDLFLLKEKIFDTSYLVDCITNDKIYKFCYEVLPFNEDYWKLMPEGFKPEQKPKFEVGKWYKIANNWYAKFKSIDNNIWKFSEKITSCLGYKEVVGSIHLDKPITISLFDLSEIQQYLPEGHPDKIVKEEEYKVGDWVIVNNYTSKYNGKVLQITKISNGRYCYFKPSIDKLHNFSISHIVRKAYPHEIPNEEKDYEVVHCTTQEEWDFVLSKFNPRNLRKDTFDCHKENSFIIFNLLKSKDKSRLGCYGKMYSNLNYKSYSFKEWCDMNNYKYQSFIPSIIPSYKEEFKVGDEVYIIDDDPGYYGKSGDVFKIYEISEPYLYISEYSCIHKNRCRKLKISNCKSLSLNSVKLDFQQPIILNNKKKNNKLITTKQIN